MLITGIKYFDKIIANSENNVENGSPFEGGEIKYKITLTYIRLKILDMEYNNYYQVDTILDIINDFYIELYNNKKIKYYCNDLLCEYLRILVIIYKNMKYVSIEHVYKILYNMLVLNNIISDNISDLPNSLKTIDFNYSDSDNSLPTFILYHQELNISFDVEMYDKITGYNGFVLLCLKDEYCDELIGLYDRLHLYTDEGISEVIHLNKFLVKKWKDNSVCKTYMNFLLMVNLNIVNVNVNNVELLDVSDIEFYNNDDHIVTRTSLEYMALNHIVPDICGCGDNELILKDLYITLMAACRVGYIKDTSLISDVRITDDNNTLLFAYLLDTKEYTDHGYSVYSQWLTVKGILLILLLQPYMETNCQYYNLI